MTCKEQSQLTAKANAVPGSEKGTQRQDCSASRGRSAQGLADPHELGATEMRRSLMAQGLNGFCSDLFKAWNWGQGTGQSSLKFKEELFILKLKCSNSFLTVTVPPQMSTQIPFYYFSFLFKHFAYCFREAT